MSPKTVFDRINGWKITSPFVSLRFDRVRRIYFERRMSRSVSGRLSSRFPRVSWTFVNETVTSLVGHLGHARVHVLVSCSPFLLGQTLHARDRSNYDLFWLRVEVQKAMLTRVTPLRLRTHTRRQISEEFASRFVREYIKSCAALSLFT